LIPIGYGDGISAEMAPESVSERGAPRE